MTTDELKEHQLTLDLTNASLARLCGYGIEAVDKWRSGANPVPKPAARIILVCVKYPWVFRFLMKMKGE